MFFGKQKAGIVPTAAYLTVNEKVLYTATVWWWKSTTVSPVFVKCKHKKKYVNLSEGTSGEFS